MTSRIHLINTGVDILLASNKAAQLDSLEGLTLLLRSWHLSVFAIAKQYLLPVRRSIQNFYRMFSSKKTGRQWVEIPLYGFVSRNYITYASGKLSQVERVCLPDGSAMIWFPDGSAIIEAETGHVIEFDRRARVTLVKVSKEEAEGAIKLLHKSDLAEAFRVKNTGDNQHVICLPGNIIVKECSREITVRLPNGVDVVRKR